MRDSWPVWLFVQTAGVCRQFPFFFVKTPEGIQTGLSFTCPSAVEGRGELLAAQRVQIEALLEQGSVALSIPEALQLSPETPIGWADYQLIEGQLTGMFERPGWGIEDSLIGGNLWLGMLNLFLTQAKHEGQLSTGEAIRYFSEAMEKNDFQRILGIARRPHGSAGLQRAFLGMVISFRNSLTKRRGIANVMWTILSSYARHLTRMGSIRIAPLQQPFRYKQFKTVRFDASAPFADEILRRVLHHALERKDLLRSGDLVRGYGLLIIFYAMIRWYSTMLAAQRGSARVEQVDLVEGVSLSERYYGAHSRFFDLFQENPVLERIFSNVLRQKNFAHSLVRQA